MATKVKGDAIKEGSIPLSALSNEVKGKIENAGGGADWNAQKGEAGYIKNKPFGIEYCSWDSNDGEYSISGNKLIVTYPWFTSIMFKEPKFDYGLCVFDKDGNDYSETISDYDLAIFFDVTYVQSTHTLTIECSKGNIEDFIDCIKPTYVNHIELKYIDGVLKTTPQTLSDTDKNQALANLGIDNTKYILSIAPSNTFNIREFIDKFGFIAELNDDGYGGYIGDLIVTNKELFLDKVLCCGFNTSLAKCIYINNSAEVVFFFEEGLAKGSVKVGFAENDMNSEPTMIGWEPLG